MATKHVVHHHAPENNDINYLTMARNKAQNLMLSKSFSMAFIINSTEDWMGMFHVIAKQPSLVKIILNYKECFHNRAIYEQRIENFAKKIWNEHRVLHIYFIPVCWNGKTWWQHHQLYNNNGTTPTTVDIVAEANDENGICFLDNIYFYDAFASSLKANTTRGTMQKYSFQSDTLTTVGTAAASLTKAELKQSTNPVRNNMKSFNEILKRKKLLNLNRIDLNISFLSSTNSYLMADMKFCGTNFSAQQLLMNKCVSSSQSSLGIDMEMLRELSRRVMFTPYIINPSDGKYYGFRVFATYFFYLCAFQRICYWVVHCFCLSSRIVRVVLLFIFCGHIPFSFTVLFARRKLTYYLMDPNQVRMGNKVC